MYQLLIYFVLLVVCVKTNGTDGQPKWYRQKTADFKSRCEFSL